MLTEEIMGKIVKGLLASLAGMVVMACSGCGGGGDPIAQTTAPATASVPGDRIAIKAAITRGSATVVFVGDSITAGANVPYDQSWTSLLASDLRTAYPNVKFKFVNLSIAGRSLVQALDDKYLAVDHDVPAPQGYYMPSSTTSLWPNGSTTGQSWKRAVMALNPDLVVIAFGMNDVSGDAAAFKQVSVWLSATYKQAPSHPSIAMVATILPASYTPIYQGMAGNIDKSAEAARQAAAAENATLIDANAAQKQYLAQNGQGAEYTLFGPSPQYGGNGANHPTTIGHRVIYQQAYQSFLAGLKQ